MGQIVKFVELVHDCFLSKQRRNEMTDGILTLYGQV